MAREILFKAKRKDNGEWVEGNLILSHDTDDDFKAIVIPKIDSNMFSDDCDLGFENWYKVDQNTICQYTGLTDKNGNKIWENDIVTEDFRNEKGIVRFGEFESQILKNIGFNIDWISNISYRQDICWWAGKCEVIGNIFDNLELLEG